MYESYWQLKQKPFENTPDPRFVYYSQQHEEALLRILYAVKEEKGAAMLTGIYGSGKTLLSRVIIDELIKGRTYEVALVTNPQLSSEQLLKELVYQLEDSYAEGDKVALLHRFQEKVYANFRAGKKNVIIIDEAQRIQDEATFEELRMLLNFQLNDRFLITLVLIGQPELIEKVNNIPQLEQRLGIKYHLDALTREETRRYVQHRLSVAGREGAVFTEECFEPLYRYSQGIPRKINNVCDLALLIGFGQKAGLVQKEIIERVVADLTKKVDVYAKNV